MRKNKVVYLLLIFLTISLTSCTKEQFVKESNPEVLIDTVEPIFPTKAIQIVVPFAPGGGTDGVARAFAQTANKYFDQPILVVNKLGQGGARGLTEGLFAENDGYTVTLATTEINTLAAYGLIDFDYSFMEPLVLLNSETGVMVVSKDFPYNSIEELINYIHETHQIFTIGSAGEGTIWNIAAAGIEEKTDIQFDYKYYDGTSLAVLDVLGGKLDIVIAGISEVKAHIDQKQVKILTVLSDERISELPLVKTFKENGYDFSIYTWRGLAIPLDVSPEIKNSLIEGFNKAAQDKDFIELLAQLNLNYDYKNKTEFEKFVYENFQFYQSFKKNTKK